MKIKIELTSTEVKKLRNVSANVIKEVTRSVDGDFTKQDEKDFKEKYDNTLSGYNAKCKIGDINCYEASVENKSGKGSIININVKSSFVFASLNLLDAFYSGIGKFILKIKEPLETFIEKFM